MGSTEYGLHRDAFPATTTPLNGNAPKREGRFHNMSATKTIAQRISARTQSSPVPGVERRVVHDATWAFYDRLSDAIETRSIRMAFDGKDIEIMTLGAGHEGIGRFLRQFIDLVMDGIEVDCIAIGSTTWKRAEIERGIEADQSYVFDPAKIKMCQTALARVSDNIKVT
jgi:hypothetical protein